MTFWSTEKIAYVSKSWDLITPYDPTHLDCASYHLTIGSEVFVTTKKGTKQKLQMGEQVIIPPGQLAIFITEEEVHIPNSVIGFISMRASIKLGGLINVSGFHVDPGYQARLKFSVYNAGDQPSVLARGDRVFLIWFADLDQITDDVFKSDPIKHGVITSSDVTRLQGTMPTPTSLKSDLENIRKEFNDLKAKMISVRFWIATIIVGMLIGIVGGLVVSILTRESTSASTKLSAPNIDLGSAPPIALPPSKSELANQAGSAGNASISIQPPTTSTTLPPNDSHRQ
jgi:dCTP deaminase